MNGAPVGRLGRLREAFELEDYVLLVAVTGLPWAFGGVPIWSFRTAALLIVCAGAIAVFREGAPALMQRRRSAWLIPAFLLGLWAAFQVVPLPAGAIRTLSPAADEIYRQTFPHYPAGPSGPLQQEIERAALDRVPEAEGLPVPEGREPIPEMEVGGRWSGWRSLSLVPDAGVERLFWFGALLIAFLLVRERCRDREVADAYRMILFALFFSLAVFGLIYAATSNGRLYWIRKPLDAASPFGPYVNPTNFAGVMELAVAWLAGYTLLSWVTRSRTTPLRETRIPFLIAATGLCFLATVATASKGGTAITAATLAVLALVAVRGWRRRALVLLTIVLLGAAVTPLLLYTPLGERLADFADVTGGSVSKIDRVVTWRGSLDMLRDYPLSGVGFGAFRDVFPAYLPAGEYRRWSHVHNDYLELVIEGGLVAALLTVWLTFAFWRRVISAARRSGRSGITDTAYVGLVLGLLALSIHAVFDFNHQIPANGLLFVTLAAFAVARAESAEVAEP
jgi:O-antigen ligase